MRFLFYSLSHLARRYTLVCSALVIAKKNLRSVAPSNRQDAGGFAAWDAHFSMAFSCVSFLR